MTAKIFIDGEVGTTGLQIRQRLAGRADIEILSLDEADRKSAGARAAMLNLADIAILCLPDAAARQAVALIDNTTTRVIDASSAHRTAPGWTYGFPEMAPGQAAAIAGASRISNPGCYPTGAIAMIRPLVDAGLVPADFPITVNAISGYSGGGRQLIETYEGRRENPPVSLYGLKLDHKHLPEMQVHAGLAHPPLFQPCVGDFAQGQFVSLPLQLWALPGSPGAARIHEVLAERYRDSAFVRVVPREASAALAGLDPRSLNGTNKLEIHLFANDDNQQAWLVAIYDNLGKGASGAAVQNLNLMLGAEATTGLLAA